MTQPADQRRSGRPFTADASDVVTFPEPVRAWVLALRTAVRDRFGTLLAFHAAYEHSVSRWEAGLSNRYVLDKKEVSRQLRDGRRYPRGPSKVLVRRIVELCGLSQDQEYLALQEEAASFADQRSRKVGAAGSEIAPGPSRHDAGHYRDLVHASSTVGKLPVDTGVFVGRADELVRLENAAATSGQVVVAVHGLGGVGKSTLAARFAELNADRFGLVWWVTADSPAAIDTGLAGLAGKLDPAWRGLPADQRTERAVEWLASTTRWLLILDNLATPTDANGLLERVRTGTVLITSRQSIRWRGITAIPLGVLTPAEAVELLGRVVRADWPDATLDGADTLCTELGCLPLAVDQSSAYIAQNRITPAHYLQRLERFPERIFTATAEGGDAQRTMARIWHVTLDRLADTPQAGQVLRRLAWYAPDRIPRALLEDPAEGLGVGEALGRLAAYNMITLTADTVGVHRLVQAVTRTADSDDPHRQPQDIAQARDTTAAALAAALAKADARVPKDWPIFETISPHAQALLDHTDPDTDTESDCALAHGLCRFLLGQGKVATGIALATRAARSRERLHGPDHPDTLSTQTSLAIAYETAGDLRQAICLLERTLADCARVLRPDHPGSLTTRHTLAYAYESAGDLGRAIPLYETTLADQVRVLGPDHPDTLTTRHNLAYAYRTAGNLEQAIPLHKAIVDDRTRVLGPDHPDTLMSLNNLAGAYRVIGDLTRAIPLLETILAARTRILGPDHPHTLSSRNNLASAYLADEPERAVPQLEGILADRARVLGPNHPETLRTRINLATAHLATGEPERAISQYKAVLADYQRVLGSDYPDTLTTQDKLANAYVKAGKPERAVPLFAGVLADRTRVLGPNHPETLRTRYNLADAYRAAGDLERAIPMFKASLTHSVRVLGPSHPLTRKLRAAVEAPHEDDLN